MLLTAGTFLQEGRYWVEDILEQDESGVSYRAQYQNLDLPVVIQTLGSALGDRVDKPQLFQAFLAEVRRQSKNHAEQPYRILDCFIESGLPFVVLDVPIGANLPSISTWLPELPLEPVTSPPPHPAPDPRLDTTERVRDLPQVMEADLEQVSSPILSNGKASHIATQVVSPKNPSPTKNGSRPTAHVMVSQAPKRPRAWLPLSLAMTALVGGSAGAFFGWQLRQGKSLSDVMPVVGPQLDTEQSFPPLEGWPGATKADPAPTSGLDQVLRRRVEEAPVERDRPATNEPVNVEPLPLEYGSNAPPAEPYNRYNDTEYSPAPADEAVPVEPYPDAAAQPEWTDSPPAPEPVVPEVPAPDPAATAPEVVTPIEKPSMVSPPPAPADSPNTRSMTPTPREQVSEPSSPQAPIPQ